MNIRLIYKRISSQIFDLEIIFLLFFFVSLFFGFLFEIDFHYSSLLDILFLVYQLLSPLIFKEGSLGKKFIGLNLVDIKGKQLSVSKKLIRQLTTFLIWYYIPTLLLREFWFIGFGLTLFFVCGCYALIFTNKKHLQFYDLIIGTQVVENEK
jgi:uncharacterized RDD family membrane protein YckC